MTGAFNPALTSPAVARNRDPILAVLRRVLPAQGTVLEANEPQAAATESVIVQKTVSKKHKHHKKARHSKNIVKQEWKSIARY